MSAEAAASQVDTAIRERFAEQGYAVFEDVIPKERCDELADELSGIFASQQDSRSRRIGGVRNLLHTNPSVAAIASSSEYATILKHILGPPAIAVRALFFDKTNENNWSVPWHQDLSIAVTERLDVDGFGGWSVKDGILHVQPPAEVLEKMFAIRLHLDDCDRENGALKVIPSSHLHGKLEAVRETALIHGTSPVVCECRKGGVLVFQPLLLHSSNAAANPLHRRVLQIEYATCDLPGGLKWFGRG